MLFYSFLQNCNKNDTYPPIFTSSPAAYGTVLGLSSKLPAPPALLRLPRYLHAPLDIDLPNGNLRDLSKPW